MGKFLTTVYSKFLNSLWIYHSTFQQIYFLVFRSVRIIRNSTLLVCILYQSRKEISCPHQEQLNDLFFYVHYYFKFSGREALGEIQVRVTQAFWKHSLSDSSADILSTRALAYHSPLGNLVAFGLLSVHGKLGLSHAQEVAHLGGSIRFGICKHPNHYLACYQSYNNTPWDRETHCFSADLAFSFCKRLGKFPKLFKLGISRGEHLCGNTTLNNF